MKHYKKTAALSMCLLIAFSAAAPAVAAYADNEDEASVSDSIDDENTDAEEAEDEDASNTEDATEEIITYTSDGFTYTIDDDGNAHLTGSTADGDELIVPDTLDGIPVTEIERDAFLDLNVTKIFIPASIVYISAENPFIACVNLTEIEVDPNNKDYTSDDGILYSKDMKKLLSVPCSKELDSYTVRDGVEELGIAAFYQSMAHEITLPASVITLNRHCFSYNPRLTSIDMSQSQVETIPAMAFVSSSSLRDVKFSESTYYINIAAFMNCTNLKEIDLPPYLSEVQQSAFQNTGLEKVIIPDSVSKIGYSAFGYNENDVADDSFTIIGSYGSAGYKYCTDTDTDYDYKNNFQFMDIDSYYKQLEFEDMNVQTEGDFMYTVIDGEACLTNCTSFSDTCEVPEELGGYKVTSIYYEAFQSCGSTNIILPETVKTIGELAFSQYLQELTIPGGCTELEGDEPFINCLSLKSITVTEGDGSYSSENGVLYNKDKTILIAYPQAKEDTSFTIPGSVKEIALSACCYNNYLESVDLSSVEKVGNYAFEGCMYLKKAVLSKYLKEVGHNAFLGCSSLMSIRAFNNIETIGDYAFGYDYDDELASSIQENQEDLAAAGETNIMPYSVIEGFKMYVDEDSLAYQYAASHNIPTVTGTVAIGEKNVDKNFIYVILGALAALIIAVIAVITGKNISRKKKEKASAKRKEEASKKSGEAENDTANEEASDEN